MFSFPAAFTAPFHKQGFVWLWASSALGSLGMIISQLVLGWIALEQTNSSAAVGAVFAARFAPPMLLGLPAGLVADMFDRRKLLILAYLGSAGVPVLAIGLANRSRMELLVLLGIAAAFGVFDTLRTTAAQAYVYDTVGTRQATTAIALTLMTGQAFGILAGLTAGTILDQQGATAAFLALCIVALAAGALLLPMHSLPIQQRLLPRDWKEIFRASAWLIQNRSIRMLVLVVAATEVFAFSSSALLPTFARDVFGAGASGLGWIYVARSIGGLIGLMILASLPGHAQGRRLLFALAVLFGASLVAFAATADFSLALALSALVGVSIAGVDVLAQALLQHNVPDDQRGSAIGVWLISTGFGPLGNLEIGFLAALLGASFAQAVNGGILVVIILGLAYAAWREGHLEAGSTDAH